MSEMGEVSEMWIRAKTGYTAFIGGLGKRSRPDMWRLGLLLCLILAGARPAAVHASLAQAPAAAGELSISRLRVQVMPEFDDPRVLVVIQGRLDVPDAAFPLAVAFRVPRGAQINQMAALDVNTGATLSQPFDTRADPADPRWSLVTFTLDGAHFFYEYYFDPLLGETSKAFTFAFNSLQPVADLLVEVQQPLAAIDFTLDPASSGSRRDQMFNTTYHQFDIGSLGANQETLLKVSYTKSDPAPSVSREQVMVAMGMGGASGEGAPLVSSAGGAREPIPVWVFAILAAAILAGASGLLWQRLQPVPIVPASVLAAGPKLFCTECGTRFKNDARFCHICGAS